MSAARRHSAAALPMLLADFAAIIGLAKALDLARARGGVRVYIPKTPMAGSGELAAIIGLAAAAKLAAIYGGERLEIPRAEGLLHSKRARIATATGSVREIALATGATERWVRQVRNGDDDDQFTLFPGQIPVDAAD